VVFGIVPTGWANVDVAVAPPKKQFDEQLVFPPEVVT
jgi:hypothetical protein